MGNPPPFHFKWKLKHLSKGAGDSVNLNSGKSDWMELAQDRDRWRALVSTVMNFRVP